MQQLATCAPLVQYNFTDPSFIDSVAVGKQFALVVPPNYRGYHWSATGQLRVGGGLDHVEDAVFGVLDLALFYHLFYHLFFTFSQRGFPSTMTAQTHLYTRRVACSS